MRDINFKKTDLLRFQKSLNDQFMSIFEEEGSQGSSSAATDVLGLVISYREFNIFVSLNDLQNIATNLKYENTIRTKSWILGYNHEHGNLYTIINFLKLMDLIIFGREDFEVPTLNINSNILYFKKTDTDYTGLLVNEFKLDYTAEYTKIFDVSTEKNEEDSFKVFSLSEGIEFELFLKEENMSKLEWDMLNHIRSMAENSSKINLDFKNEKNFGSELLTSLISNVYLDAYGQRPVFTIDTNNLLSYISILSPL